MLKKQLLGQAARLALGTAAALGLARFAYGQSPDDESALAALAAALALFGAGFLFRPLGALVFGRIGDRAGRKGAFLMTRAVQKHMVEAKFGRVVSLSSTSALGNRGQANYSTAKAGLQGLTKTLAIELGPFGITANAVNATVAEITGAMK